MEDFIQCTLAVLMYYYDGLKNHIFFLSPTLSSKPYKIVQTESVLLNKQKKTLQNYL